LTVDLVVKNSKIYTPYGFFDGSIVVDDGKIVALNKGIPSENADRVLDAKGMHLLPGMVDMHTHFRDPGFPEREDFTSGTTAAAVGGITTVADMPNTVPSVTSAVVVKEKIGIADKKSLIDFALIGGAGDVTDDDLLDMAKEGVIGYKTFMTARFKELAADDAKMIDNFYTIETTGLPCLVHAENQTIVTKMMERAIEMGRIDPLAHCEFRPAIAEEEATMRTVILARNTGVHLHICHMTAAGAVDILEWAQKQGQMVTGETSPNYLLLNSEAMKKHGPYAKIDPPLRGPNDQETLWWGLNNGIIDVIASDHAPYPMQLKEKGWDNIFEAPSGGVAIEYSLPLMLNAVNQGLISLNRLVEVFSENPTKICSLYPKKGSILPGADADFVIVDMDKEFEIKGSELHSKQKKTPFEGWKGKGQPIHTYVRGTAIVENGIPIGKKGYGKYQRPKIIKS